MTHPQKLAKALENSQRWIAKLIADRDGNPNDYIALAAQHQYDQNRALLDAPDDTEDSQEQQWAARERDKMARKGY